jgi:ABC-type methionine transport system ATPase subunit
MDEIEEIRLSGKQPAAKISDDLLDKIIKRDFKDDADIVRTKFIKINSSGQKGKNRILAGILKLANQDINVLDGLIEKANTDFRDILLLAEYPRNSKIGFEELDEEAMKNIYIDDFTEYSIWLNNYHE